MEKNISFTLFVSCLFVSFLFAQEDFHLLATMSGDSTGDQFSVVSHIGDVNADGYDDVIVGAPGGDYAKLFFGGAVFDTIPDLTFRDNKQFNCYFGCSIAGGGDVNGDGYPDIIIGASSTWIGPSCPFECFVTGAAYVYFGGPGIDTTADLTLIVGSWEEGTGWYYGFGKAVTIPGDLNGDGYDDFVISAPNDDYDAHGRVYIYFGGPEVDDQYDVLLEGEDHFDNFGLSIAGVGDINKDGFYDVLIGAPMLHNDIPNKIYQGGKAYLVYGGNDISLVNSVEFIGDTLKDYYGRFISGLGDVNGDSVNEIGIMADKYYKIISGSDGIILMEVYNDNSWDGNFQNICGDKINNDNYSDILISLEDASNQYAGKIQLFLGRINLDSIPDFTIEGNTPQFGLGLSTAYLGDLNNDDKKDICMGERYQGYPDTISHGKVYIYSFGNINSINEENNYIPDSYKLYQNFPNPFNSSTIIRYSLPQQEEVTLNIYDQLGRLVTTLIDGKVNAGEYRVEFYTENLSSGVYYYQLVANNVILTKKLLLLK